MSKLTIETKKIVEIRNALAVILRAYFKPDQDNRLLIVRQMGKIDSLLPKVRGR